MNKKISSKTWLVVFALIGCLLWAWVSRAEIVVCSYLIRYGVSFSSVRIEDRLLTVKLRSNGTVHCTQDDINGMEVVFNLAVRDKAVAGKIDNVQMIITGKTLKGYPPFEGTDLTFPSDDPPMDFTWVLQEASSNFAANYGPPTAEELESRHASEAASTEETVVESGEIEETETDTEDKEVAKSEERIEIDVKLESTEHDYFVFVDELVRENDCYIITGVKKHHV